MRIRRYETKDCPQIVKLFYDTVHTVNAGDYTEEQLEAWAPETADLGEWDRSFCRHYTVVAEDQGQILGFGDIDSGGYLDRLYVHKDAQRKGIAAAICSRLEEAAESDCIVTHASITARPFFAARGYRTVKEQQVIRRGVSLTNYIMEKDRTRDGERRGFNEL